MPENDGSEHEALMTPAEVAAVLKVPARTLYAWRYQKTGPPCFKVGRHLRYRRGDVERWLLRRRDVGEMHTEPLPLSRPKPKPKVGKP